MVSEHDEWYKEEKELWERLFDGDRFRFVIRLPRKYRKIQWNVVRVLGDGKLTVSIYIFIIFIKFFISTS